MSILNILASKNYILANKIVARRLGLECAVLLGELCSRYSYFQNTNQLTEDGYFYATIADVEEETTLKEDMQRKCLNKMASVGILETKQMGMPSKRYIRLNEQELSQFLSISPGPDESRDKTPLRTGQYNNNNNKSHVVSKDTTFDKGHSQSSARSETQSSGKLFSSERAKTTKSSVQKINSFITACQREAIKKEFPKEVLQELDVYFRMLAEMNCLLPSVSIAQQLSELSKVPAKKQVQVVKDTVGRGWRSLQYAAQSVTDGTVPSWDTANPDAFTPKTEEEKKRNKFEGVDPDHIF